MELDSDLTFKEIKDQLKSVFFPNRRSFLGSERRFNFSVGNYDGQNIDENKKLYEYVGGNAKPRIYLRSKVVSKVKLLNHLPQNLTSKPFLNYKDKSLDIWHVSLSSGP